MLHQFRGPVRFQEDAWREIIRMEIAERRSFERLDKMIEDNLRDTSTIRKPRDEDWTTELRSLVEVKFYWISHGRRGRRDAPFLKEKK
jgi:hypothetical protein